MIVVLVHDNQTQQMQLSMEPVDPALAIQLLQQAVAVIKQQTGVITPAPDTAPTPPHRRDPEICVS